MKKVREMAIEAGFEIDLDEICIPSASDGYTGVEAELLRFAELVRADERSSWPAEMEAMERQVNILTDALAEQPAQQEPVCDKDPQGCWNVRCQLGKKCKNTPAQRKPLTDEEIVEIYTKWESTKGTSWADLMRAIEAAHGIKEKNNG